MLGAKLIRRFSFSGPYNPHRYRSHLVPRAYPTDKEIEEHFIAANSIPSGPIRNMRHVNPVRQSGPLPPHDGPYTMEDIRKIFFNSHVGQDYHYTYTDPEEIMRRVPGITRREAERITKLGLDPDEQVDFAYIVYNNGIDVFYEGNSVYVARQVLTNAKGQKTEVYWNALAYEDMSFVPVGNAPVLEMCDYTWEIFLWGEPPIHPLVDFDLSVPATWFEYEEENWNMVSMMEDQASLPDDLRKPGIKHPNASRELWRSQENHERIEQMRNPNWTPLDVPEDTYYVPKHAPSPRPQ
jgi:hypothetical protein